MNAVDEFEARWQARDALWEKQQAWADCYRALPIYLKAFSERRGVLDAIRKELKIEHKRAVDLVCRMEDGGIIPPIIGRCRQCGDSFDGTRLREHRGEIGKPKRWHRSGMFGGYQRRMALVCSRECELAEQRRKTNAYRRAVR